MKKAFYVLMVMVVLLGMFPTQAEAKKTTGMYVSKIEGTVGVTVTGYRYTVEVLILDVNGNRVFGARVNAETSITPKYVSAYTDDLGVAWFFIYTDATSLTFTVDNVVMRGYVYLPEENNQTTINLVAPPSP
jgi:hypothetical protein